MGDGNIDIQNQAVLSRLTQGSFSSDGTDVDRQLFAPSEIATETWEAMLDLEIPSLYLRWHLRRF